MTESGPKRRGVGVHLGATILIIAGVIFLLRNLDILPPGLWGNLWRFWPVALILLGINFFFGGSRPLLVFVVTIAAILGVVVAVIWMSSGGLSWWTVSPGRVAG